LGEFFDIKTVIERISTFSFLVLNQQQLKTEEYKVIMDLIDLYTSSPPSFSEENLAVYVVSESG
jgi:hypothetical protein